MTPPKFARVCIVGAALAVIAVSGHACRRGAPENVTPTTREIVELPLQGTDANVVSFTQRTLKSLSQSVVVPEELVYTDVFKQQELLPPVIDILIVIDNSYSMEEEQANLADKLSVLLSDLNEVDWQINVITTDNTCKRLPELPLKPDSQNMAQLFQTAVRAGINGSASEVALKNVVDHLKPTCTSDAPWVRPNTDLAVLIVSDEDEDSYSKYYRKSDLFVQDMQAKGYIPGENFKVYGLIGHPDSPCPDVAASAQTYADVVQRTDGLWGSICAGDYSETLAAISRDMRSNLKVEFPLRFAPILSTIKMDLNGAAYIGDWTLVGQSIVLADKLPENSTLTIQYQVESFRLLNLGVSSEEYVLNSIFLEDRELSPTEYAYDPVNNTVLLFFDPPANAVIHTNLIENKQLLTTFPFPNVEPSAIACFIGDDKLSAEVSVGRGSVTIMPPPPAGAKVHCLFEK